MPASSHIVYDVNPSTQAVLDRAVVRRVKITGALPEPSSTDLILATQDGQVVADVSKAYYIQKYYDPAQFVKGFMPLFEILPKLNKAGLAVFCYIIGTSLEMNKDFIYFDITDCCTALDYQSRNVHSGIRSCLDNGLLFKSPMNNKYWINKERFFNGKRLV